METRLYLREGGNLHYDLNSAVNYSVPLFSAERLDGRIKYIGVFKYAGQLRLIQSLFCGLHIVFIFEFVNIY